MNIRALRKRIVALTAVTAVLSASAMAAFSQSAADSELPAALAGVISVDAEKVE